MGLLLYFFVLVTFVPLCSTLECYVCHNQDGNFDKCVKTVQTCNHYEDYCLSEVKWGSLPFWQQGADKMYYISKTCATKQMCEQTMREKMPLCDRIWYNDWECAECCQGDRCNFYITLGASSVRVQLAVLVSSVLVAVFVWRNNN